jgi:large subunit ribosomal protein L13
MNPKTYSAKASELNPRWYVVDVENKVLGRIATEIAQILRGKFKPTYTPHMNCGDFVIVINAAKVAVTRDRLDEKIYYRHSQYPGGLKTETLRQAMARHPERVIEHAVKGMLPHNRLGADMLHRLKVYAGPQHPHEAQQPVEWQRPSLEIALADQDERLRAHAGASRSANGGTTTAGETKSETKSETKTGTTTKA